MECEKNCELRKRDKEEVISEERQRDCSENSILTERKKEGLSIESKGN